MDFLRRNLFVILCIAGAGGGLALIGTGVQGGPKVLAAMEDSKKLYESITRLQKNSVNKRILDQEQLRIDRTRQDLESVLEKSAKSYEVYQPLLAGVFPSGDDDSRRNFRRAYEDAMNKLMGQPEEPPLRWGRPATATAFSTMKDKIADEQARLASGEAEPDPAEAGPKRTEAGVLTRSGARVDPQARAHMAVAQRIQCYAEHWTRANPPRSTGSLDFDPAMIDVGTVDAPLMEDCWRAQIGFWIQRDVVNAIAEINGKASAEAASEDRWVESMPVKEVISIRTSPEYILPDAGAFAGIEAGGYDEALPPGTAETTFTQSVSNEWFDVVQFTVKLVMDQRDVLRFVDELCNDRFYTLLRLSYAAVPTNRNMIGKIYGSEPAVNIVMDFEAIMLGDVFRKDGNPMMPSVVCDLLSEAGTGVNCPTIDSDEDEE